MVTDRKPTPLDEVFLLEAASHFRWGNTKTFIQKVLFCAEEQAVIREGLPFPSFPFFRWTYGPYSAVLAEASKALVERGLMRPPCGPLTPEGRRLLEDLKKEVAGYPKAQRALNLVTTCAERFSKMDLKAVLRAVYNMKVMTPRGPMRVEQVPHRVDLIQPPSDDTHRSLLEVLAWRLSQTEAERREEDESPLLPDDEAEDFINRVIG
jgi:hypothetical protein